MPGMEGKVALITGAGSGIGRASALRFAREGVRVVVVDLAEANGAETVRLVEEAGGEAAFVRADVSRPEEAEAMVAAAVERFGRLDYAYNNASATSPVGTIVEYPIEAWEQLIAVNLTGVWLGLKYEIPAILAAGGGAIVNAASVAPMIGAPLLSGYTVSKAGVIAMTAMAANEFARQGLRVNAVAPSLVGTERARTTAQNVQAYLSQGANGPAPRPGAAPGARTGHPEEVAEAVVWLCSDAASFITGQTIVLNGSQLPEPGWLVGATQSGISS